MPSLPILPILDARDAAQVLEELLARRGAYVPELAPARSGAAQALLQIFARYAQVIIDRLNQAPDKNLLAFLDMLGISLIPAQSARAPVVFQPLPQAADGRIVAGTRLGAQAPGGQAPLAFETESSIALAAARLVAAATLWPARDEYVDHSMALAAGREFKLFKPAQPVRHEIYLAHDTLLAFTGKTTIEIEFELSTPGSSPLRIIWEHWDGQAWCPFKSFTTGSQDGAAGLTRSGVVTLRAECGQSVKTTINGLNAHWLRGRLDQSLPPDPARQLPAVDRVRLRTVIERPLRHVRLSCVGDIHLDQAFAGSSKLDLSATFFPFGRAVDTETAFYFASEEIFGKPGAKVKVCLDKAVTPEEEADAFVPPFEGDVNAARMQVLNAARNAAETVLDAAESMIKIAASLPTMFDQKVEALRSATPMLTDIDGIQHLADVAREVKNNIGGVTVDLVFDPFTGGVDVTKTRQNMTNAKAEAVQAAMAGQAVLDSLKGLPPVQAAAVLGSSPPALTEPQLVWEYWNGRGWQMLVGPLDDDTTNFLASGEVSFVVPQDLEPTTINDVTARWLRARLAVGSYQRLRLVSWFDSQSNLINFFPVIEARPPALRSFTLGYTYRSPWQFPEQCLTFNDFQFELRSPDVRRPGAFFPPFRPVADVTPTLYLGFDRPLPNDLVSLYLDIQESDATTPPLVWEAWDGTTWRVIAAIDETENLRRPGMISFISPDVAPRPRALMKKAGGSQIKVGNALEAAAFRPGDKVVVRQGEKSELAVVRQAQGDAILLETPLANTYTSGDINLAALPRFGQPLDWVRARLKEDGAPAEGPVNGVFLNAAWVRQVQTINDELLGSGLGQPNQSLFFAQSPVLPGEQIEVRELEGAIAQVEFPILKEELFKRGLTEDDFRLVSDPRTGQITEVWVRWQSRPHLFFSGPDDRHYTIERARGRLIFGDGQNGRLPTPGSNNIRARRYQAGGGLSGNVPAGAITQLLSSASFVQSVINPRAADGGADGELPETVKTRGPQSLRHRWRSLAARDYEALAREASPGVAVARALPATASNGRPAPGWVTLIIVPQSQAARPQPSGELRRQVHDYLVARAPATVNANRIAVIGPTYLPIGVFATVAPREAGEASMVEQRVRAALEAFLQPLGGGPDGLGWPFGRDVFLSDVAAVLEAVEGVDYVRELDLLLNDVPTGARVAVPVDRIVAAGPIRIEMQIAVR